MLPKIQPEARRKIKRKVLINPFLEGFFILFNLTTNFFLMVMYKKYSKLSLGRLENIRGSKHLHFRES